MFRLDAMLVALVVASALGVVSAQHQARRLYAELQREQSQMQQLDVEWGQLQLEQSTWAAHARIEKIAREQLHMQAPKASQLVVVEGAQ